MTIASLWVHTANLRLQLQHTLSSTFILFNSGCSVSQNAVEIKMRQDEKCSVSGTVRDSVSLGCTYLPWVLVRCSHLLDMLLKLMN